MPRRFAMVILLLLTAWWIGLPANAADKPAVKVKAFVSILPVAYFVERVGGSKRGSQRTGGARARSAHL